MGLHLGLRFGGVFAMMFVSVCCFVSRSETNELAIYPYRVVGRKLGIGGWRSMGLMGL